MIYRDPKCVFVADSPGLAEVVVLYLGQHDVAAQVMNPATLGGLLGLTVLSPTGISASGIEVWVHEPAEADRALQLLADHKEFQGARLARASVRTGSVAAVCDECGKTASFPAAEAGSVQNCPYCRAYLDVPDPESDLDGAEPTDEGPEQA